MDIELLKTFLEVRRTRHFGKAADNLFVTQSTVSARIKQLEDAVGAPLFTRQRNDIQLTPAGQRLVKYAENIITTWNRARQEIAIEDEDRISLSMAGLPSLWDIMLQDWLEKTSSSNPDLLIHAEVLGADIITRRLMDGSLDLGFLFEVPQISELAIIEIASIPLILVSSKQGQTAEIATTSNYLLVDWGNSFANAHAKYFHSIPSPALRLGLGRVARDFLLNCGGSAYLAEPMVINDLKAGHLHRVEDAPVIMRNAYAAYLDGSEKKPIFNTLLAAF